MSDVLEKTDEKVTTTNDGDHDKFQHYFPTWELEQNILNGTPMKAVCGKIVKQQVDPLGRTICQECQAVYDGLED